MNKKPILAFALILALGLLLNSADQVRFMNRYQCESNRSYGITLASAGPNSNKPTSSKRGGKDRATEAGHAVKNGVKETGHAIKKGAKSVGHSFKRGGKAVGHTIKRGAKNVGHFFKGIFK